MNFLKLLNPGYWLAIGALIAALYGWHAWDKHTAVVSARAAGAAEVQGRWDAASLKAEIDARVEEQRRTQAQKEITNEAQRLAARARSDAAAVDAAAPGLRNAVAAIIGSGIRPSHPASAIGSTPATDPGVVHAIVFGEIESRLRALGKLADDRGAAGAACERIGDSLTP